MKTCAVKIILALIPSAAILVSFLADQVLELFMERDCAFTSFKPAYKYTIKMAAMAARTDEQTSRWLTSEYEAKLIRLEVESLTT